MLATAPVDPEGDALEITFELYDSAATLLGTVVPTDLGEGTVRGVPTWPLPEDAAIHWGARAVDERGGDSGLSDLAIFTVDVTNEVPGAPVVLLPESDATVDTAFPRLAVEAGPDPEGDAILVRFTVDVRADFDSPDRQDLGAVEPAEDGYAEVDVPLPLPENEVAWARARAEDDRGGASSWTIWSFRVDAIAEAPGPIRIVAPGEDEAVDSAAVQVRWAAVEDPDGEAVTYELALARAQDGDESDARDLDDPFWSATGLTVTTGDLEGEATVDVELEAGAWLVRGRATDETGLSGDWGPTNRFVVLPPAGQPADLEPGDGPYGCDCEISAGAPAGPWLLALLPLVVILRRRR
jgi:MYXO-CTERM domain-containing protein